MIRGIGRLAAAATWAALICVGFTAQAAAQASTSYTYDALGRVIGVIRSSGDTVAYAYDAAGNRTQVTSTYAAPTVSPKTLSTPYNTPGSVDLAPAGTYTSVGVATPPAKGSVSIVGTTATYTPNAGTYGPDSFTFTATGPGGTSTAATVSVTVGIPSAPGANNTTLSVAYNSSATSSLSVSGVVTGLAIDANPSKGTVSVSGATVTYTATWPNYGADSFTYHATGPGGSSPVRTVAVTIGNGAPPTASNGAITTGFNTPITFTYPKAGDYAVAVLDSSPAHGSVSTPTLVSGVGYQSTYTPTSGYYGLDTFNFHASSPFGASPVRTISVTVAVPPAPTVANASISLTYNGSGAVVLPVSGVYSSIGFPGGSPAHGVLNLTGSTVTYYPTAGYYGGDSFTYNATGPGGASSAATVSVTVSAPQPPVLSTISVTTAKNNAVTFSGTSTAWDPNELGISLVGVGAPAHGAATFSGGMITYTPTTGYTGSDSFSYTVANTTNAQASSTVNVTVQAPAATLAASLNTAYWGWSFNGSGSPIIDPAVTVSASGGTPGYTYAWQYVSGDSQIAPVSATSLSTGFQRTVSGDGDWIAYWRCKVTDSTGVVAYSAPVRVEFYAGSDL